MDNLHQCVLCLHYLCHKLIEKTQGTGKISHLRWAYRVNCKRSRPTKLTNDGWKDIKKHMFFIFVICGNNSFIPKLASLFYRNGGYRIKIKCGSFDIDIQWSFDRISIFVYVMEPGYYKMSEECRFNLDWSAFVVPDIILGRDSLFCGIWVGSDLGFTFFVIHSILIRDANPLR